jgi:ABC-type uncharacterized transport system permease subunit
MNIYPKFIQAILTFVIPLGLCLFFPFRTLFAPSENPVLLALVMIGFTATFAGICLFVWSKMIKLYESTGT